MKRFFRKKWVKAVLSLVLVFFTIVAVCNAAFASVALQEQKGVAVCDDWSPEDAYTADYAQSIDAGDGAFQEYITMPVERIIPGRGLSPKALALIEPFSISCHALSRAAVRAGDRVLIMGAGPIGLFALLRAKSLGARVAVADLLESRLALAESYGADCVIPVKTADLHEKSLAFTEGNGYDVCVEACGAPETFLSCIEEAAHGANIILIGNGKRETTFVHSVLLKKELNVFGSRNALTADFETLIDPVAAGGADVLKMVSAVYEKEDAAAAFEALTHNDGSFAKVLLRFADAEA